SSRWPSARRETPLAACREPSCPSQSSEDAVELLDRQAHGDAAPVWACAGQPCLAPVLQQPPHLRDFQRPSRPHRAVAGHGCEDGIVALLHRRRRGPRVPILQQRTQQNLWIALAEERRHGPHNEAAWTELLDLKPEA